MTMNTTPKNAPPANGTPEAKPGPGTSTAMVLGSDAYRGALEPRSTGEAFQLAEMMASIGYCGVTTSAEALGRIMTGRGLGLSAMQSMRGVYTVHGRPGIDAALMQALCLQSPLCEYFRYVPEESVPGEKATFVTKRRGNQEIKHSFTIQQAVQMNLVDRGEDAKAKRDNNWNKGPDGMLRARARSELARIEYPDVVFGMYTREEIELSAEEWRQNDPNEMVADIIKGEEAAAPAVTTVQAAKRDYAAEAEALKAKIRAAGTSRQATQEVREAISAWDGVEPYKAAVAAFYNEVREERKKAGAAVNAEPAAGTAASPAPMPEGNLFAGTPAAKDPSK